MQQDWVLDVLSDLKTFAQQNGMFNLAEHLDDTLLVAAAELEAHVGAPARVDDGAEAGLTDQHFATGEQPK